MPTTPATWLVVLSTASCCGASTKTQGAPTLSRLRGQHVWHTTCPDAPSPCLCRNPPVQHRLLPLHHHHHLLHPHHLAAVLPLRCLVEYVVQRTEACAAPVASAAHSMLGIRPPDTGRTCVQCSQTLTWCSAPASTPGKSCDSLVIRFCHMLVRTWLPQPQHNGAPGMAPMSLGSTIGLLMNTTIIDARHAMH